MVFMKRRFVQVDVFGENPYRGNPLAVVVDAEGLTTSGMQTFAKWTNLSETTFLLPPTHASADYQVRIFTPTEELPFAGHPTLGSAHAWLTNGGVPKDGNTIVQECKVGLVNVRRDDNSLSFAAPPLLKSGPVDDALIREAAESLGISREAIIDAAWIDNGPGWIGILLASADEVLAIQPKPMKLTLGVAGAHVAESRFAYEVRAFYSSNGITLEDPVTGSLNASLAQWLISSGRFNAPYLASQGTAIGYAGVVKVDVDDLDVVWIGGNVATCISGEVDI
jgi:PhzF family phenazine biosynthesis protein